MSVFLAQAADPTSTRFQCAELLVFDDRPDVAVLRATVTDCLDQIEVLQSAVTATPGDDGARLVPHPHRYEVAGPLAPDGAVDLIDWCAARIAVAPGDDADRTSGVDAPFSLSGDMLSGHDLLDLPDGRFAWLARFHHVIADGFAVHVIIRWIAECYTARVAGAASPGVADRFLSHAECLGQAAQTASSPAREADLEYWRDLQFPVSPPVLARHRPTPAPAAPGPRRTYPLATTTLSPDDHRALRTFARDHGVSEATVLAAVTGHYVAAVSGTGTSPGSDPAVLGLPVMGRPAGSRLTAVDPAVTVLPLVVEPHLRPDDSLAAVDRALAGLRRHSGCRAEDIRRVRGVTDPDRLLTGPSLNIRPFSPLFRFGDTRAALTTISTGPVTDLEFIAQSRPDSGLDLQIIGRPTWHTHDDADRHCRGVAAMIRLLVHARPRHWAEIPLRPADHPPADPRTGPAADHPPADQPAAARDSADCATPGSATSADATAAADPTTLTRLLRDARERDLADPDLRRSPGVRSPVGDLDRAERWREVDHLADHLLALGAGPGRTVGIHLRRSPASCMAVVATALTGAAWVPLNPDLPPDRLASMVETCPPDILVTDVGGGGVDTDAPVVRLDPSSPPTRNIPGHGDRSIVRPRPPRGLRARLRTSLRAHVRTGLRAAPRGGVAASVGHRVRHLHVGLDGPTEGCRRPAPRDRRAPVVDGGSPRGGFRRPARHGFKPHEPDRARDGFRPRQPHHHPATGTAAHRDAEDTHVLRRLRVGAPAAVHPRHVPVDRVGRRAPGPDGAAPRTPGDGHHGVPLCPECAEECPRRGRPPRAHRGPHDTRRPPRAHHGPLATRRPHAHHAHHAHGGHPSAAAPPRPVGGGSRRRHRAGRLLHIRRHPADRCRRRLRSHNPGPRTPRSRHPAAHRPQPLRPDGGRRRRHRRVLHGGHPRRRDGAGRHGRRGHGRARDPRGGGGRSRSPRPRRDAGGAHPRRDPAGHGVRRGPGDHRRGVHRRSHGRRPARRARVPHG
ncbi:hypothetical protein CXF40_09195 [Corynebacterium bovis]|nr:hypothetical protein CXF40_09195 [Corynebacterium bovis]